MRDENEARSQLIAQWVRYDAQHQQTCRAETSLGPHPSYVEVLTCLCTAVARHPRSVPGGEVFDAQSEVTPFSFPQRDTRHRFTARSRPEEARFHSLRCPQRLWLGISDLRRRPSENDGRRVSRVGVKKGCLAPSEHLRRDGGSQLSRVATAVAIRMRAHCTLHVRPATRPARFKRA